MKLCQSDEILPNLVTLITIQVKIEKSIEVVVLWIRIWDRRMVGANGPTELRRPQLFLIFGPHLGSPFWTLTSATRLGIFCSLGYFLKPLATINLPRFLGNFCKGAKIYPFSSEIIFGQLLETFGDFYLVTLTLTNVPTYLPR